MTTSLGQSILIALHRVGPYHHARFQAAAELLVDQLIVLETRPESQEYPWIFDNSLINYQRLELTGSANFEQDPPLQRARLQLEAIIKKVRPVAIVTIGWADPTYILLLHLGQIHNIPLIVVSDSRYSDMPRSALKEWLKSQLLRGYSAAIVAGKQSSSYIQKLGFARAAVFKPWDVVDNDAFASSIQPSELRHLRPFLCVGRLIPEKNHALLLKAFSSYQSQGGQRPLLLVGHGPLENHIKTQISSLPSPELVHMLPFQQLDQLKPLYWSSHALILPSSKDTWGLVVNEAMASSLPVIVSSSCGCVDDLVEHGVSGWTFQHDDMAALLHCLTCSDAQSPRQRELMTVEAQRRLSHFSTKAFALALQDACSYAIANLRSSRLSLFLTTLLQFRHQLR